jgi:hypothetical protein
MPESRALGVERVLRPNTKRLFLSMLLICACLALSCPGSAAPYSSYTYNFWSNAVPAPHAYVPVRILKSSEIGASPTSSLVDLDIHDGIVYLVDARNSVIILLDYDFRVIGRINTLVGGQGPGSLSNPHGIHVVDRDRILIADRDNSRIVAVDIHGNVKQEIGRPKDAEDWLFPTDFRPEKVAADSAGRVYALAAGVYDGIMTFTPDGEFRGYIGAPRVRPSLIEFIWSRLATREQRERQVLFLPVEHSNVTVDSRGMIMATVSAGAINPEEVVRRLNPAGTDVLVRKGFFPPAGDVGIEYIPAFADVLPRSYGMYSAIDRNSGRVFTYDVNGNLLYVFGGHGQLDGLFQNPVAIAEMNGRLLVLDSAANQLTLFAPTEYSLLIHRAIAAYNVGRYKEMEAIMQQVLRLNSNYELAYSWIGRALLMQEEWARALEMFRLGNDREGYSRAFRELRRQYIEDRFGTIVLVFCAVLLCWALVPRVKGRLLIRAGSSKAAPSGDSTVLRARTTLPSHSTIGSARTTRLSKMLAGLTFGWHVIFHPLDGFERLKSEKRGSTASASAILLMVTLTYVVMRQYTGFVFNPRDLDRLNILLEICSVVVPFALWCVVNWALTTIMLGKGTFRDVYIAGSYALIPLIVVNLPLTFISNYLVLEEGAFYYLALALGVAWTVVLLVLGTMVTHEYTLAKTVYTTVFIVAGMMFAMFLGVLFVSLLDRVYLFVSDVYTEIALRT